MKQLTRYRYEVTNGETVTIIVTPVDVGPRLVVADNGSEVPNTGTAGTPRFKIKIDQVEGNSHFVLVDCGFLGSDPSSARFDLELRGSGGGNFSGISIRKTNAIWDPMFRFTVA